MNSSDLYCVFQFKLVEVEEVVLLTKKGYLTIALSHVKDGRVLLRRHEGIRDWFNLIKVCPEIRSIIATYNCDPGQGVGV